jgi:hypothetical protein
MIRIGIDEAGYGPQLGPLVIGGAAVRVPDDGKSVRDRLRGLVCRSNGKSREKDGRPARSLPIPVDDSKKVFPRDGVAGLARGVLAFLEAGGHARPAHLAEWLDRYADRKADAFREDPWFERPEEEALPGHPPPPDLRERFLARGVEPLAVVVSPVPPRDLNDGFDSTGNKGRVLFLATAGVLLRLLERCPGEDAVVVLDREGGRLDYAEYLSGIFPFGVTTVDGVPKGEAHYFVREGGRTVRLVFATGADASDLPAALASMAAKMTRELFLARMNAWFSARLPGLRGTAGYFGDGRRFLREAAPVLEREGVDLRRLVRSR